MTGQEYGICRVAIAPLRTEPSDRAEISTQLLFGDAVEIIQKTEKWWKIRNAYDDYEGWMDFKQLAEISSTQYLSNQEVEYFAPLQVDNILVATDDSRYYLSAGSCLPLYKDGFCYLGEQKFQTLFTPFHLNSKASNQEIADMAMFFLNAPYLWGGCSLFGIDCSGLVQIVFKMAGIKLKRDAAQQAEQGKIVHFLPEAQLGDLAFFDNDEGRIIHVGILLSNNKIIHASGRVRIDSIDDQGIYNAELGKYSHRLRIIKRFMI